MEEIAADRVKLSVAEASDLSVRALMGLGFDRDDARLVTDHVIDAALCGYEYSGLPKILNVREDPRFKEPRRKPEIVRETPVSALVDGGNNVGMVALSFAVEAAIRIASASGIALVGVSRSWMSGRLGYYTEKIARAGLVGIQFESTRGKSVAPPGSRQPVLGTNPLSFGIPTDGAPLVFDMGTAAMGSSDVAFRARTGRTLPPGVAIDAAGQATTDAAEALKGALLTFGGHKGFGLSLVIQMLGTLSGAAFPSDRPFGAVLIAFRPDLLSPDEQFRMCAGDVVRRVKAAPMRDDEESLRIPFERALKSRERLSRDGIVIDKSVHDALAALSPR